MSDQRSKEHSCHPIVPTALRRVLTLRAQVFDPEVKARASLLGGGGGGGGYQLPSKGRTGLVRTAHGRKPVCRWPVVCLPGTRVPRGGL